ncbi:MAG: tRNA preQ1(34) S-adenosylmethionine ribosyltransferase-isomerase QueA [Bacteroidota bacterium]
MSTTPRRSGTPDYHLDAYDFDLPETLVAQEPAAERDQSRLLVVGGRADQGPSTRLTDSVFSALPRFLEKGDVLVLNDTRVFPARLVGRRATGGRAELLLIEAQGDGTWTALARPGKKLNVGATVSFGGDEEPVLTATVVEVGTGGRRRVSFAHGFASLDAAIDAVGRMPLPPYIRRPEPQAVDFERYQTVYAQHRGSVAAPTAGLHFTPDVLDACGARGIEVARLTHHVGYGTFEPVRVDDLRDHRVAAERFTLSDAEAATIETARRRGGRVIAVGTTSTRALESAVDERGRLVPGTRETSLTITPGYRFRAIDGLVTNFHLPRSSLLVLVSALAGRSRILEAYRHAVAQEYRFYSYGDAMLILPERPRSE